METQTQRTLITFGSFLPPMLTIVEEIEESEIPADGGRDEQTKGISTSIKEELAARRHQFFVAIASERSTPADEGRNNRNTQMGKALTYVPPITRDGKITVKIEETDIKAHERCHGMLSRHAP